ncbi:hypothetical protein [Athalassotoga sp.]|uniref:hypothetical protein n=1 Tax=Athalassotoga sp. TaxID=2022597 RepID=UPI003CFD63AB
MIFFGILTGAFFYFIAFVLHVEWSAYAFFAGAAIVTFVLHKKRHFKISQITLIFLYLVTILLWSKDTVPLVPQFVYILSSAAVFFVLSDMFFKIFFSILSWLFVGATVALLMYERFGSILLSILIGLVVIPIGLRDRKYVKDKDRSS